VVAAVANPDSSWVGPEKACAFAVAALVNRSGSSGQGGEEAGLAAGRRFSPEQFVISSLRYLSDALTKDEALAILKANATTKAAHRELERRVPATQSAGWLGYPEDKVRRLTREAVAQASRISRSAGATWPTTRSAAPSSARDRTRPVPDDRCQPDLDVGQAIEWVKQLAPWNRLDRRADQPDTYSGISGPEGVEADGIGARRRAVQKPRRLQTTDAGGRHRLLQIDSCRMGGVNEILSVILLARSSACRSAAWLARGLCEYVQHLAMSLRLQSPARSRAGAGICDHLHEPLPGPGVMKNGRYMPPNSRLQHQMKRASLDR